MALIAEKNILFGQKCLPVDCPKASTDPVILQYLSVVRKMHMVVVHRGQARQQHWPSFKRFCALGAAQDTRGVERMPFYGKFLPFGDMRPAKISGFGECTHD